MRKLTAKQEKFKAGLLSGKTQADAYRKAYNAKGMTPKRVSEEASRLAKHPMIAPSVAAARKEISERAGITLEQHLKTLKDLREEARDEKDFGPAISAEVSRGRASGLYVERKIVINSPISSLSPELQKQVKDILDGLIESRAAEESANGSAARTTH